VLAMVAESLTVADTVSETEPVTVAILVVRLDTVGTPVAVAFVLEQLTFADSAAVVRLAAVAELVG